VFRQAAKKGIPNVHKLCYIGISENLLPFQALSTEDPLFLSRARFLLGQSVSKGKALILKRRYRSWI
ncbi:MAG: hypothetical protein IJ174_06155, partial [Clostridia bacterium]|nr:hypothetical protein [Clostridia bacterium]